MNQVTEESKSNVTPRLENDVHKPAPDLIKSPNGEIISEDGIQVEAQTVNSKYKLGSEQNENAGSGVYDK